MSINTKANNWNSIVNASGIIAWLAGKYTHHPVLLYILGTLAKNQETGGNISRSWHVGLYVQLLILGIQRNFIVYLVRCLVGEKNVFSMYMGVWTWIWSHVWVCSEKVMFLCVNNLRELSCGTAGGSTNRWPVMWPLTPNNHMLWKHNVWDDKETSDLTSPLYRF